ncbi:hypothetical protein M422DRAFT_88267, partial [Sphaerobolus stellatus SS14]
YNERYNSDLDVQLILVWSFSAVSSAFIIQMQSELQPTPTDLTNSSLRLLVEGTLNKTFTNRPVLLPSSLGYTPKPLMIVKQAWGYLILSLSLLSTFGAALRKQW